MATKAIKKDAVSKVGKTDKRDTTTSKKKETENATPAGETRKLSTKKKTAKSEPSTSMLLEKIALVSDSNKALQKEIKTISGIFGDNQKILISMKAMMDTLTSMLGHIQKQPRPAGTSEDDMQKLYEGLSHIKAQSDMIDRINDQTVRLQEEISRISELQDASGSQELTRQIMDSKDSIQNNSKMIIKIARRIDEIRDDLRTVSGKADSLADIGQELDGLRDSIKKISGKAAMLEGRTTLMEDLRQELDGIKKGISSSADLHEELDSIKITIDDISSKAAKIDPLGGIIEGLNKQFKSVKARADTADSIGRKAIGEIAGKIDKIEAEINTLAHRADSTAFVGQGLEQVQKDVSSLKHNISDRTTSIEKRITSAADILKRQDASSAEFHKKADMLFKEMQTVKSTATRASSDSSKEVMALLKLSEYQSSIRMYAESKYGDVRDLRKIATKTTDIINLFDKISIESGEKIPLPHEVRRWAVGKILDCADRWEIRFGDVYPVLTRIIGRSMLKEVVRIKQVREIYGIKAVDKIRKDLGIT